MYVTVPLTFCAILKLFTVNINWASFLCNGMMSNDTFTASSAFYKEYTSSNTIITVVQSGNTLPLGSVVSKFHL